MAATQEIRVEDADRSEKKRVLVVDDDHDFALAVSLYLKQEGLDVVTAGDGVSAVEAAETMSPDAIVLDIRLPQLDGLAFCNFLRRGIADRETPVIVVSGHSSADWKSDMLDAGANAYMTKPCNFSRLHSLVMRHMGASD